jgi:adenylate cyclase
MRGRLALMRSLLRGDPADASGRAILLAVTSLGAVATILANVAGAVVVFVLLAFVLPVPEEVDRASLVVRNLVAGSIYLGVALVVGAATGLRKTVRTLTWLRDDRDPTPDERDAALGLPLRVSLRQSLYWIGATILFTLLHVRLSPLVAVEVLVTMIIGTAVMASVSYLTYQRLGRPVVARALQDVRPDDRRVPGVLLRTFLFWGLGTGLPLGGVALVAGLGWLLGADSRAVVGAVFVLAVVALVSGLATILMFARSVADPLRQMRRAVQAMEGGDFHVSVPVNDATELGYLQASLNRMALGMRERERLRDLFGRHVGPEVARRAFEAGSVSLGGEQRHVGVLFVDIIGSTAFTADHDPTEVVDVLNRFFGEVVEVVHDHDGIINKFEGDAALCVWGAPLGHPDPAGAALAAARRMSARLAATSSLPAAIGVSAGLAVAGNIGSPDRLEYTVIGDPVIEAARLTELAKARPGRVLASRAAVDHAAPAEAARWQDAGSEVLRGRTDAVGVVVPRT